MRNYYVEREQNLSFEIAVVLIIGYVLSLVFSLKTHLHLYVGDLEKEEEQAIGMHG